MEQLGIEPKLLLAQVVNFTIIIVVLTKLLYRPILGMLEKRKKEIEEGLRLTQKLQEEEEKLKNRQEKMLVQARQEGHVLIEEAREQAEEEEKEILAHARAEADELIAKGRGEVEHLREELVKKLRQESVDLATAMAKRLLTKSLFEKDQHAILAKHLKSLETFEAK